MFKGLRQVWAAIPNRVPLAVLAAVLFALVGLAAIISPSYQPNEHSSTYKAQPERPSVGESRDDKLTDYTFWLMLFTGVLAFGTLALWYVTWQTLKHAERSSERQLRAYMNVASATWDRSTRQVRVTIRNCGKTPALNVDWFIFADNKAGEQLTPKSIGGNVIGPDCDLFLRPNMRKRGDEHSLVIVFGMVTYKDVFGENHETRFQWVGAFMDDGVMRQTADGNSAT